jgi:hypothetical protein
MKSVKIITFFLVVLFLPKIVSADGIKVEVKDTFNHLYFIGTGNNDYSFISVGLKFRYSESDVINLNNFFLHDSLFSKTQKNNHYHSNILLGKEYSLDKLSKAFDSVSRQAQKDDAFIFYYNGILGKLKGDKLSSGWNITKRLEGNPNDSVSYETLLTTELNIEKQLTSRWLKNKIDEIPCTNIIIIIDANDADKAAYELMNDLSDKNSLLYQLKGKHIRFIYPEGGLIYEDAPSGGGDFYYTLSHTNGVGVANYFFDVAPVLSGKFSVERQGEFKRNQFVYVNDLDQFLAIKEAIMKDVACDQTSRSSVISEQPRQNLNQKKALNYALLIGVDEYDAKENWKKLSNPVYDATALDEILKNNYGFETKLLKNPGGDEIMEAIANIINDVKFDSVYSQLFIFIASHGGWDVTAPGFIVPKDAKPKSEDPFRKSYLKLADLKSIISNINCPHILIAIDACYGGTFDELISKSSSSRDETTRESYTDIFVQRTLKPKSRLYLTSGGKEKVEDGRPGQHSPFAKVVLDELSLKYQLHKVLHFEVLKARIIEAQLKPEPRSGTFDERNHDPGGAFLFVPKQ